MSISIAAVPFFEFFLVTETLLRCRVVVVAKLKIVSFIERYKRTIVLA